MSRAYSILSLLRRHKSAGNAVRSEEPKPVYHTQPTRQSGKRQLFTGKPPEPVPLACTPSFGGAPRLRK